MESWQLPGHCVSSATPVSSWALFAPTVLAGCSFGLVSGSPSLTDLVAWILGRFFRWRIYCSSVFALFLNPPVSTLESWSQLTASRKLPRAPPLPPQRSIGWPWAVCFILFNPITRKKRLDWAMMKCSEHLLILLTSYDFHFLESLCYRGRKHVWCISYISKRLVLNMALN